MFWAVDGADLVLEILDCPAVYEPYEVYEVPWEAVGTYSNLVYERPEAHAPVCEPVNGASASSGDRGILVLHARGKRSLIQPHEFSPIP